MRRRSARRKRKPNTMSDFHPKSDSCQEEQALQEGVKQIVVTRERTPRNPRWQRAWWRTLQRYTTRLNELHEQTGPSHDAGAPPQPGPKGTDERP
jgi:hypothetical protein